MTDNNNNNNNNKLRADRHEVKTDKNGVLIRPDSFFRNTISKDPSESHFTPEKNRYILYANFGCPWAHRTLITRRLKGLDDIIELIEVDDMEEGKGWVFGGRRGPDKDPRYGFKYLRELYEKADPSYEGRITVPVLWDTKTETIVNNESAEIIRIFYSAFDDLLPQEKREEIKGRAGLFPANLRAEIEEMNTWVYDKINNGVYKCGFASSQEAYDASVHPLFDSLDKMETHLAHPAHQPYLFGESLTEADIRLFTTLIRFDVAYYPIFKCNFKMIRHDYPHLHRWLRSLYWDPEGRFNGAFREYTGFHEYKIGYIRAIKGKMIVPAGPYPDILPL